MCFGTQEFGHCDGAPFHPFADGGGGGGGGDGGGNDGRDGQRRLVRHFCMKPLYVEIFGPTFTFYCVFAFTLG